MSCFSTLGFHLLRSTCILPSAGPVQSFAVSNLQKRIAFLRTASGWFGSPQKPAFSMLYVFISLLVCICVGRWTFCLCSCKCVLSISSRPTTFWLLHVLKCVSSVWLAVDHQQYPLKHLHLTICKNEPQVCKPHLANEAGPEGISCWNKCLNSWSSPRTLVGWLPQVYVLVALLHRFQIPARLTHRLLNRRMLYSAGLGCECVQQDACAPCQRCKLQCARG